MNEQNEPNLRFWVLGPHAEPVKLTLRPGQTLGHSSGGPCEEGYSYEAVTWRYPENVVSPFVIRESTTFARDCDGRLDTADEFTANISQLAAHMPYWSPEETVPDSWKGVRFPDWIRSSASQRDHNAEAMGY